MSRPLSDAARRLLFASVMESLERLSEDPETRAACRAELSPGERDGLPSALLVPEIQVYPVAVTGVVRDVAAVLDWAEQYPPTDPHPLAGAFLDPSMARLYAPLKPPGLSFYDRAGHLRIKGLSAATAVAGRTQR